MVKKRMLTSIIATVKWFLPVLLILFITPQLWQFQHGFAVMNRYFVIHRLGFALGHVLFYCVLFFSWPQIGKWMARSGHELSNNQLRSIMQARWYLLASLFVFELLFWWR